MYGLSVNRCAAGRSTPTAASDAAREVVGAVHPHGGVGELHDRRLEMGGVVVGADLVGGALEAVDHSVRRVEASGRRADRAHVVLPGSARRAGEHRRRDRRELAEVLGRQGFGAQDQIGGGGLDGFDVGRAAGAHARHVVDDLAQIRRLAVRSVGHRGGHHPRLQAQRAEHVELVAGEHHDALRVLPHLGFACGMADRTVRRPGVDGRRFGCAGFVWPALIAEHARTGDLRGAGDDGLPARRRAVRLRPVIRSR